MSDLERGRLCYEQRAWADAFAALSRADEHSPLGMDDLERLVWASGLAGHDQEMLRASERLYRARCEAGQELGAARAAFWAAFRLLAMRELAQANGWLARAQRLVERRGDCAERGYLLLPVVRQKLASAAFAAAYDAASTAAEIGERFADVDLLTFARHFQGLCLLRQGEHERGLALVDEAMLAVTGGDLSPIVAGVVYCSSIGTCQRIYALDRAREWTAALAAWCEAQPQLAPFGGACHVHRAQIFELSGAWGQAVEEAVHAADRPASEREVVADACYQQGEIHRLRGETSAAEEAYRRANRFGRDPQPGLALLRLSQGRAADAASAIRRVLQTTPDALDRTRLLPAHVEISLGANELDQARAASEELGAIAARFDSQVIGALAAQAQGSVRLTEGDAKGALAPLRAAFEVWQALGAPYRVARVRVALARACRALGDRETSELELEAAREVFEELGAAPELESLALLRGPAETAAHHPLTGRELQVLRLVAAGKTNKLIARELFVSEKTIDRHVSNIFSKIDVASRAAATAYAYEHGLVSGSADRLRRG